MSRRRQVEIMRDGQPLCRYVLSIGGMREPQDLDYQAYALYKALRAKVIHATEWPRLKVVAARALGRCAGVAAVTVTCVGGATSERAASRLFRRGDGQHAPRDEGRRRAAS